MPSRRDLERLSAANRALVESARRELRAFVLMLPSDPVAALAEAEEFFPALVRAYGDAGVAVAAEWLDEVTPRGTTLRLALGEAVDPGRAVGSAQWAMRDHELDREQVASALAGSAQRYILAPGRSTIRRTAAASRARYARVPMRSDPCAFCVMLASRGAVYESERTASRNDSGDKYHDDCYCQATLIFDGQDLPEGYDPEALYGLYMTGRSATEAKRPSTSDILSRMREIHGMR